MDRNAFMKTILLLFVSCLALANARQYTIESLKNPSTNQQNIALLSQVQKTIDVNRKSLKKLQWIEVEKNEIIKMCLDTRVLSWETSLNAAIYNDSCLVFQAPTLIGVDSLKAFFRKDGESHKINLAIGMKYLNFKNEKVLLGYNEYTKEELGLFGLEKNEDPERIVSVTGEYLVDKYPVTNCEFTQLMWDHIPAESTYPSKFSLKLAHEDWLARKRTLLRNENCMSHDTAASTVTLYQAMVYANERSKRDGLKPFYIFSETNEEGETFTSHGYILGYWDFTMHENNFIKVREYASSDGYRLLFYDEWMMLARGGDKKNKAPWGDTSATYEDALKYAVFNKNIPHDLKDWVSSEPVGQLQPNGYGLYDMFGLVKERVLLKRIMQWNFEYPSCIKGGAYRVKKTKEECKGCDIPFWKLFNYGYYTSGAPGVGAGFRLVRNIGNNVKWKELETEAEQ